MFLRQLDLTTALRPSLYDDESLLFVQDNVGLYEGKFKLERYQNGAAYLTSHRVCYVDNSEPRKYSVAVDLKEIDRAEFYAGFLKSSPKITLFPKPSKRISTASRGHVSQQAASNGAADLSRASASPRLISQPFSPTRDLSATWVCPICGLPNPVPTNFDPSTANQHTPLPPCQACGIKPPLILLVKASIAAMSNRAPGTPPRTNQIQHHSEQDGSFDAPGTRLTNSGLNICSRCTFRNHPSLKSCEVCGAPLESSPDKTLGLPLAAPSRLESPGPSLDDSILGDETIETIKFSFRAGGVKTFLERLNGALVQRKWLLQSAPPVPKPGYSTTPTNDSVWQPPNDPARVTTPQQRVVGIAGLERRGAELRESNQAVIGTAFEDLEALMTSAKEVIAMAEQFARQTDQGVNGDSAAVRTLLSDSASALGLVTTKDMLGAGSTSETLYITELSRNLAEYLTDDRKGILRKEGGIMSLVDLWAVFNRTRNGIELVSPLDCEKAATMWESLHMPIRLRRFKSGLLVVQEKSRTDEKTIAALLAWLREPQYVFPPPEDDFLGRTFGKGVTAQETAEKFGWSIGVATEELEMAEETGALCRDQCLDGTRFWEDYFAREVVQPDQNLSVQAESMSLLDRRTS